MLHKKLQVLYLGVKKLHRGQSLPRVTEKQTALCLEHSNGLWIPSPSGCQFGGQLFCSVQTKS